MMQRLSSSLPALFVCFVVTLLAGCDSSSNSDKDSPDLDDPVVPETGTVYLNYRNMTVAEGENSTPSLNNTVSLDNVIDAETASSVETHTQSTHVWHTGEQLELLFDLQQEYSIITVHFWNYFTEFYDVDTVELTFVDSSNAQTASITINPEMGTPNPVESEDIDLDEPIVARFITAVITGDNSQSDFQNIGFTALQR